MTISRSRGREKKLRRDGTEKKREQKKDWTKKKIKEITEAVQKMTDDEFDGLEESLRLALSPISKIPVSIQTQSMLVETILPTFMQILMEVESI